MIKKKIIPNKHRIISEYLSGEASLAALGVKYDVKARTIQSWVRAFRISSPLAEAGKRDDAKNIAAIKKELHREKLKNALLEEMLRLGEAQTGMDLRKKFGTRQS